MQAIQMRQIHNYPGASAPVFFLFRFVFLGFNGWSICRMQNQMQMLQIRVITK